MYSTALTITIIITVIWTIAWLIYRNRSEKLLIYPFFFMLRLPIVIEPSKGGSRLKKVVSWVGVGLLFVSLVLFYYEIFEVVYYRYFKTVPGASKIGLAPLIPGVTVPWSILPHVLIALGIAALFHELSHALVAKFEGLRVKSAGLLLFAFIPAAFVEIDEDELKKAKVSSRLKIYSAGVAANVILALIFMGVLLGACPHLTSGIRIVNIEPHSPAYVAGLEKGDIIVKVNGINFRCINEMVNYFKSLGIDNPAKKVSLTVTILRGGHLHKLDVVKPEGYSKIGIMIVNNFNNVGYIVYFSAILNYALALVNAAPLFITDGARILDDLLKLKFKEDLGRVISMGIQTATLLLVLSVLTIAPIIPG